MNKKIILVVEDDEAIREGLCDALAAEGYEPLSAAHGLAALELLSACSRPSLILLDINMPVMDGRQFLLRKKQDASLATIPVVVTSAAVHKGALEGADAVLAKPYKLELIFQTIEKFCPSRALANA